VRGHHGLTARAPDGQVDATAREAMVRGLSLLALIIDLYSLVVFVTVILSWVRLSPENPLVRISQTLVEPVLAPIRRILPDLGGIDLSPMVLLLALRALKSLVL
jgi:uncharacterized protein YggT (Ycf19 family)